MNNITNLVWTTESIIQLNISIFIITDLKSKNIKCSSWHFTLFVKNNLHHLNKKHDLTLEYEERNFFHGKNCKAGERMNDESISFHFMTWRKFLLFNSHKRINNSEHKSTYLLWCNNKSKGISKKTQFVQRPK